MNRLCFLACLALLSPAFAQDKAEQVQLSLDRYARLMKLADARAGARVTWSRGSVAVTVGDTSVQVVATARVRAVGEGPVEIPLLPADAVLGDARVGGNGAALLRLSGAHVAVIPELSGEEEVRLEYVVPILKGDDGAPYAVIALPPMAGASFSASGVGSGAEVWPSAELNRSDDSVSASLPASSAVVLKWGAGEQQDVRRVDYALKLDESGDGVEVEARFEVVTGGRNAQVPLTGISHALVDLTEGGEPVVSRVVGEWHTAIIEKPGRHVLVAKFRMAIDRSEGQPQVTLQPNHAPMARVTATVPGAVEVEFEPEVPVTNVIKGEDEAALTTATAWLPPVEEVVLRWTEARAAPESQVRANTETYQLLTLEEGVLRSKVFVKVDVINGKLKELPIALPEQVVLYKVEGAGIEDWRIFPATEKEPRLVRVVMGTELEGSTQIELQLEMVVGTAEGTPLQLPVIRPLSSFRELGVVALFDGDKVGFAPAEVTGLTPVGQDALPVEIRQNMRDKVSQAYKHVGEPGTLKSKVATAKAREVRFDARVDTLYQVREGSLQGNAAVLVELKSGRQDVIMLSLPKGLAEPRITAPSLNKVEPVPDEKTPDRQMYAVRFTQALEGAIQLDVEFELILGKDMESLQIPDLRVHGAEVEAGSLGIAAETGMELTPGEGKDLRRVTAEELPKAVRLRSEDELRLAWTYARAPWSQALGIKRNKTVETLDAIAQNVWLESNVLENGHRVTRATYQVANEDRQFLKLKLPEGAQVLSVASDGRKVKAVQDATGTVAIPLPKSRGVRVEVTYDVAGSSLWFYSGVDLAAPVADLRSNNIQWLVRVPSSRSVLKFSTDLKELDGVAFGGPGGDPLPGENEMQAHLFGYSVQDADQEALTVTARTVKAPGALGQLLILALGLLCLLAVTRRRARGQGLDSKGWALLAVGVVLLLVKSALSSIELLEFLVIVGAILAVGFASRVKKSAVT